MVLIIKLKKMKKLLLGIITMLAIQTMAYAAKDVTITVSSDGATKEEAIANALRSAIEQTYGTFVSSNTTILNDKLVSDEIVSLSRGNIKKYKILAEEALSPNRYYVVLSAVVNMEKLVTYVHGSASEVEVDLEAFDANVRMEEMNKKAEQKVVEGVIAQIQSMENFWDYSIRLNEPQVKGDNYIISGVVSVIYNQNTCNAVDLLIDMLKSINLDETEINKLGAIYGRDFIFRRQKISLSGYDFNHQGGTTNHWPITYIFPFNEEINLRNNYKNELIDRIGIDPTKASINPALFAAKIKFIVEPFDEMFVGGVSKDFSPRGVAGGKSYSPWHVTINGNADCIKSNGRKYAYLIYGNYSDRHGHGTKEKKHKKGDVALEIDISFTISKEDAKNVKKIIVRGL